MIEPVRDARPPLPTARPDDPRIAAEAVLFEIRRVIVGQDAMLERVLVALLAGGHLLLEGVPGLAKTLTIKTLAEALDASFRRIQFTPDLVPADLVGTRIYRPSTGSFDTELGPVFCNFLLADEINRAPAKVQSALLEVMQERQVTIGRESHRGPAPVPRDGDPEPDRVRGHLPAARGPGRPVHDEGRRRLPERRRGGHRRRALAAPGPRRSARSSTPTRSPTSRPRPRTSTSTAAIIDYAVAMAARHPQPRARRPGRPQDRTSPTARARAARSTSSTPPGRWRSLRGRRYVVPADIADLAPDVLRHRIVPSFTALAEEVTPDMLLAEDHPGRAARPG